MAAYRPSEFCDIKWRNDRFLIGPMINKDAYGIRLAWGRRSLLEGRLPAEGDMMFADEKQIVLASGRDIAAYGSLWKAIMMRMARKLFT